MLNFCDFIQVYVFTTNHHLKHFRVYICIKNGIPGDDCSPYCSIPEDINIGVSELGFKVVICGKYINLNKITKI